MNIGNINLIDDDDNNKKCVAILYDTGGGTGYRKFFENFIKSFDCILLIFDAYNQKEEKEALIYYCDAFKKNKAQSAHLVFVANKIKDSYNDGNACWSKEERINFINKLKQNDEEYIEIDCKEGYNIRGLKDLIFKYTPMYKRYKLAKIINLKALKKLKPKNKCI